MDHPFNKDLREALDSEEAYDLLPHGTWMEGGCGLLAQALQQVLGTGELVCVGRRFDGGVNDHVVLRVDQPTGAIYLDYDGIQTKDELIKKVTDEWHLEDVVLDKPNLELLAHYGIVYPGQNIIGLARVLVAAIGPITRERISMCWLEMEEA